MLFGAERPGVKQGPQLGEREKIVDLVEKIEVGDEAGGRAGALAQLLRFGGEHQQPTGEQRGEQHDEQSREDSDRATAIESE